MPKEINITPTWNGLFPVFKDWIYNGTLEQKKLVCEQLKQLCDFADNYNKENKK